MDLTDEAALDAFDTEVLARLERNHSALGIGADWRNNTYGRELRRYLLLTHWPELVGYHAGAAEVLLARYFWFRRFVRRFVEANGPDAGLEQQSFQILEQAEGTVDWDAVEILDKRASG